MTTKVVINTPAELSAWCSNPPKLPCTVEVKAQGNKRSLSQNALQHTWYTQAAKHFSIQGDDKRKPDALMKIIFKQMFLGTEDIQAGKMVIKDQLRESSKLDPGEAQHYMDQILEWCTTKGCALSCPEDSEYSKLRECQNA